MGDLVEVVAFAAEFANEVVVDAAVRKFGGRVLLVGVDELRDQRGNRDASGIGFGVEAGKLVGTNAAAGLAGAGRLGVGSSFAVATARHGFVNR